MKSTSSQLIIKGASFKQLRSCFQKLGAYTSCKLGGKGGGKGLTQNKDKNLSKKVGGSREPADYSNFLTLQTTTENSCKKSKTLLVHFKHHQILIQIPHRPPPSPICLVYNHCKLWFSWMILYSLFMFLKLNLSQLNPPWIKCTRV